MKDKEGEVPCVFAMQEDGEVVVEKVLTMGVNDLTEDEILLLYLRQSQGSLDMPDAQLLQRFLEPRTIVRGQPSVNVIAVLPEQGPLSEEEAARVFAKKYKPVALKVRPVLARSTEEFRIVRDIKGDPLANLPVLPEFPPEFVPRGRYTRERMEKMDGQHRADFLMPEERKLLHWLVSEHNDAFAWDDSERGKFKEEYFPPVDIQTIPHVPWVEKPMRIPPAIYDEVCRIIKRKIDAKVYEPSNSSYRSRWFCVIKKDGKSLRLVHSLEPLNKVTIAHSGLPPATEELAMHYAGRACNGTLDLFVGYDERQLAESSRDLTTFQTPFGALRLVTLPMGWTNSVPIFHDDVSYILKDEIPEYTMPYIDDVGIRGPATRYEDSRGVPELHSVNPGIRRFVWEHMNNVNRILQRMKYAGGTFSGSKTVICADHVTVVGFDCSYLGRKPTSDTIAKIMNWGDCEDTTDVRAFLGTAVMCRNHIPHFVTMAAPLYELCKKGVVFEWGTVQKRAQQLIKERIQECFHTRLPKFPSNHPIVMAIDTSWRAIGYYLYQRDDVDPKIIHYIKFNSILMDERQQRYSQPKRELFGLRRALEKETYLLLGSRNLVIEMDAKYIFGMLNNPGKMPNATINRWVDYIRTNFHFTLVHKKGKSFGPDGLSRRKWYPGDPEDEPFDDGSDDGAGDFELVKGDPDLEDPLDLEEFKAEIDNRSGYYLEAILDNQGLQEDLRRTMYDTKAEILAKRKQASDAKCPSSLAAFLTTVADMEEEQLKDLEDGDGFQADLDEEPYDESRRTANGQRQDQLLIRIRRWLLDGKPLADRGRPISPDEADFQRSLTHYFVDKDGRLYHRSRGDGEPKLVVEKEKRMEIMRKCHDQLGHRGTFATHRLIAQRFWWPEMEGDIEWYVRTCHLCQVRQKLAMELPPVVTHTPSIFQVLHADTLHISPPSNGCSYVVHGRCGLSSWMEARALRQENARAIGQWLFEDIVCRWGSLVKIVTDNGAPFKKAVKWLEEKYGIQGVTISPYNSQANGVIERPHWDLRQMLYKATGGEVKKWFWYLHHVMWADRITIRKGSGCSPYFMVTGAHPTLPLDVIEATWLVSYPRDVLSTTDLIGLRAMALAKHVKHVETMRETVTQEKIRRALRLEEQFKHKIRDYQMNTGDLVLVRNSQIEASANRKMKPRYLGPMVVVKRLAGGAYILAELDGSVWQTRVAAARVIPYLARKRLQPSKRLSEVLDLSQEGLERLAIEAVDTTDVEDFGEGPQT